MQAGNTITGTYTAPEEKHIALIWDNSYSILRSKVVAYVVRVLRPGGRASPTPPVASKAAGRTSPQSAADTTPASSIPSDQPEEEEEEEERGVALPLDSEMSSPNQDKGEEEAPDDEQVEPEVRDPGAALGLG